jgi:hypothetical protein
MYAGCGGHNRKCTCVVEGTVTYIRTGFLGRTRSVQADVRNSAGDLNKPYRRSETDLWAEEISRDLLRFGFLIILLLEDKVVLIFWWICIGWEGWFCPQNL